MMESGKNEIMKILCNWDIEPVSFKKAEIGDSNCWIVQAKDGKYVLKSKTHFHNEAKPQIEDVSELDFERKYLQFLKDNGFPFELPIPIKAKNGSYFLEIGRGFYWLYRYIEGVIKERFNGEEIGKVARMMAQYHSIVEDSDMENDAQPEEAFAAEYLANRLEELQNVSKTGKRLPGEDRLFLKEAPFFIKALNALKTTTQAGMERFPLHRDIKPAHIIWNGDSISGVIDFDDVLVFRDAVIKDIAHMLKHTFRKQNNGLIDIPLTKCFMEEYVKERPLTRLELDMLPDSLVQACIGSFASLHFKLLMKRAGETDRKARNATLRKLVMVANAAKFAYDNRARIAKEIS